MSDLDPRFVRVILAADAATRDTTDTEAYDALCEACEQITDTELDNLRARGEA